MKRLDIFISIVSRPKAFISIFNFILEYFLQFLIAAVINQPKICSCSPIFTFDFFGKLSTTTPESVISDYRHQKKTDSSFEHSSIMKNVTEENPTTYTESNADFYAEVFGRLVGSVRSSFADLISDIKKRNQYFRDRNEKNQNKEADELEEIMRQLVMLNETSTNSLNDESDVMSRKTKRNPFILDEVGQLTIPINLSSFENDLISEEAYTTLNDDMSSSSKDEHWLQKYYEYFEKIKENHHNRKERKIMNLLKLILTPVLKLNKTDVEETFDDDIMFSIIQGNQTIGQVTPFQILRILHKESNDRIQLRMKLILKRIVYKYARLYYIARKNYKNSHGHHQELQNDETDSFRLLDDMPENDISDSDFEFSTNDAKHNFQSVEGIAILLLEIFGAFFAIYNGFWAQLEGGYFYDLLE